MNATLVAVGWVGAENSALDVAQMDARAHRHGIWLTNEINAASAKVA